MGTTNSRTNYPIVELIVHAVLAVVLALGVSYLHSQQPVAYLHLISEDWHGEYTTAISFLVLAVCFFAIGFRRKGLHRWMAWGIAAAGFFVGMEELSWGQRILGISTPGPLKERNLQGELTLHNLVFLPQLHQIAGFVLLGWAAVSLTNLKALLERLGVPVLPPPLLPWFLLTAYYFIVYPSVKADEVGEFFLGLGLALLGLYAWFGSGHRPQFNQAGHRLLVSLIALATLGLMSEALTRLYSGSLSYRLNTAAARDYPHREMYEQSDMLFAYIYEHPEYLRENTRIEHARILLKQNLIDRAGPILLGALEDVQRRNSDDADDLQTEGEILVLLDRNDEAEKVLARAVSTLEKQLETMTAGNAKGEGDESARLLWSLAKCETQRGNLEQSRRRYDEALATPPSAQLSKKIRIWGRTQGWTGG